MDQEAKLFPAVQILLAVGMLLSMAEPLRAAPEHRHFLYLSDQRVVTLEIPSDSRAILNYINLGPSFEILEAPMLLVLDAQGKAYRGHLLEVEEPPTPLERFRVRELIPPGTYDGYTIRGDYRFQAPPQQAFLRIGARILELEPLSPEDFELKASQITELDLAREARKEMLVRAGFSRGYGRLHFSGSPQARPLDPHFPDLEVLAPVVVTDPAPLLPSAFSRMPDPVMVVLHAKVSRAGGLFEIEVAEGLDPQLDQLAVDTVQNSWTFLPAVAAGEVSDAEVTLNVVFRRTGAPPPHGSRR